MAGRVNRCFVGHLTVWLPVSRSVFGSHVGAVLRASFCPACYLRERGPIRWGASPPRGLGFLPDSRLVPLLKSGDDITIVWDVSVASLNAFAVPLGSTKKEAVEGFLASVTTPGPVAKISELLGVAPINSAAKPKLDEFSKQLAVFDTSVNPGETVVQDVSWYAKNFNDVSAKVTAWLAG